jgi:DNA-binding transcriptional LysR family regulator
MLEVVELRHLRYFVAVASELHFARAAQRLFVSQPALSQQIRSLEAELGLKLFERNRRGVRLTPEGAAFLAEAQAVVRQADHAAAVARALAEGATGHLRLGYVLTVPGGPAERVVREYQRRYPGVEVTAESGSTARNVERLREGELDAAFVHTPFEDVEGLAWVEVASLPLVVALPSAHPLSRRRRVRREQLAGVPLVYFPRHYSPGVYDRALAQVYGAHPPEIPRTEPTAERILVAVAEGEGATLVVEEQAATLRHPGVTFRRFAEPEPTVALAVAFPRQPPLAARRFVEIAQEIARQPKDGTRPRI